MWLPIWPNKRTEMNELALANRAADWRRLKAAVPKLAVEAADNGLCTGEINARGNYRDRGERSLQLVNRMITSRSAVRPWWSITRMRCTPSAAGVQGIAP